MKVWHYYGDEEDMHVHTEGLWAGLENKPGYEPPLEYQLLEQLYVTPEQARGRISGWVP